MTTNERRLGLIVILDTEAVESVGFEFDDSHLSELLIEADEGSLRVALTDIQVAEIRAHVEEQAKEVKALAKALKAGAGKKRICSPSAKRETDGAPLPRLLRHSSMTTALAALGTAADLIKTALEGFLKEPHLEVIATGAVPASRVMPNYFVGNPPFGPGRKKDEFPDAISIEAIKDYAESVQADVEVHVVSNDGDWQRALSNHPGIRLHGGIADVLEYARNLGDLGSKLEALLVGKKTALDDGLAEGFPELEFSLEDDWNADIANVEVIGTNVTSVVVTESHNRKAKIEFSVDVHFSSEVTYTDPEFSVWDSEVGDYGFQSIEKVVVETRRRMSGAAEITLSLDLLGVEELEELTLTPDAVDISFADAEKITPRYDRNDEP